MVIAVAVALVQYANVPVLRQIARFYIWVIRGTPLLVQLFIIFYGLPSLGIMLDAFPAAVIAFAFNEGAYCAETMRGALESVPQGQLEAGYCVGMSWWQIMRRIVLPQALRTAVPALSNSLIGMIKDTSLASNITVAELFMAGQRVAPAPTYSCPSTGGGRGLPAVLHHHHASCRRWGERLNAQGFQPERVWTYGMLRSAIHKIFPDKPPPPECRRVVSDAACAERRGPDRGKGRGCCHSGPFRLRQDHPAALR